jgi:parvulin-like peptidyl-prolyl isomerase
VYLSGDRQDAFADAEKLLARLQAEGADARTDELGDPSMLAREMPLGPLSEVSRAFGTEFAEKVMRLEPGEWTDPVNSPYGLHLVLVLEREEAKPLQLSDVRPVVERELIAAKRRAQLDALYQRLLEKYAVTVEMPKKEEKPPTEASR